MRLLGRVLAYLGGYKRRVIGVSISPGATAFARSRGAQRSASARVSPTSPAFDAA